MTIPDFLAKLEQTPRTWRLDDKLRIRSGECCPVTVFEGKQDYYVRGCAQRMGLPIEEWNVIVACADANSAAKGYDPALRRRLLVACNLQVSGATSAAKDGDAK